MSESIAIPARPGKQRPTTGAINTSNNGISSASDSSSSSSSSEQSPVTGSLTAREKGKMPVREREGWSSPWGSERRQSLLSSSISRSEHTVVNIGDPDGPPRLITCVKASQGFDWNQDIFLPSYASDHDYAADLERRQDPVEDIFISDEEAARMFPR